MNYSVIRFDNKINTLEDFEQAYSLIQKQKGKMIVDFSNHPLGSFVFEEGSFLSKMINNDFVLYVVLINTELNFSKSLKEFYSLNPKAISKLIVVKQEKLNAFYWHRFCSKNDSITLRKSHEDFYKSYSN